MGKPIAFDIIARDKASKTFAKIGGAAKLLGVVGLGGIVTSAVQTEAQFSKTMNLLQAGSGASGREMDKLRKLAIKMGADTQFSASGAAEAMLELSRGGMKPATIQGGALAGTLTLAAAGQLELGEAANIAVKSMGQFGLKGKDMAGVAAALAGGANASSASVRDMSMALAQGGLAANSVGFSIQETTAALAAFSNAGLEGSDAGTSMKTMLDRLQPTTNGAKAAMRALGAWSEKTGSAFVKSNGEFKSAAQIAEILHKGTSKLTQAEAKRTITQAFGSDAQRAATIFAKEGAKGMKTLLKATSDQTAAQKMANASMKGSGGALERMQGSLETASLAVGQLLAPAVVILADNVSLAANAFVEFTPKLKVAAGFVQDHQTAFLALAATIAAVVAITKIHTAVMTVQAAGGLLPLLKATKLVSSAMKVATAVQWLWTAAANVGNTTLATRIGVMYLDTAAWVRNTAATAANRVATLASAAATAVATTAQTVFTAVTNALTLSNIRSAAAMTATRIGLLAGAAATAVMTAAQWALNVAMSASPVTWVIIGIVALVAVIVLIAKKTNWFQTIWNKAWGGIKAAFWAVFGFIKNNWKTILAILVGPIGIAVLAISKNWGRIKAGAAGVVDFVKGIPGKLKDLGGKFGEAGRSLINAFVGGMKNAAGVISGIAGNVWSAVKSLLNGAIDRINSALEFKIAIPSAPDVHVNPPNIPHLARGGTARRAGLALVGERGAEVVRLGRGDTVFPHGTGPGGGGGVTVIVHGFVGNESQLGREIEKVLSRHQRTTGRPLFT